MSRHYSRDITNYYHNQEMIIKNLVNLEDRTMLGDQKEWLEKRLL